MFGIKLTDAFLILIFNNPALPSVVLPEDTGTPSHHEQHPTICITKDDGHVACFHWLPESEDDE